MDALTRVFRELRDDERGATMVDYAVLLTILTLTLIATVTQMSNALITFFNTTASVMGAM
jgi:Flp pilus assembly pilin Flp